MQRPMQNPTTSGCMDGLQQRLCNASESACVKVAAMELAKALSAASAPGVSQTYCTPPIHLQASVDCVSNQLWSRMLAMLGHATCILPPLASMPRSNIDVFLLKPLLQA